MRTLNRARIAKLLPALGSTRASALAATLLLAALGGCETPPVVPGLDQPVCDPGVECRPGVINGSVVYSGPRRGDVILLLFAAENLPPPDGTASTAVSLSRVPAAKLFTGGSAVGPFGAPFLFTNVKAGNYQIRAFLDVTGDFDPFADFTQSPRAGAPTGGSVTFDAGGPKLTSFSVPANTTVNVNVALGLEAPYDPPAFRLSDASVTSFQNNYDRAQVLVLESFNPNVPRAKFSSAKFGVELSRSSAGLPQVSFGDGLVDVYPLVLLRQLESVQPDGTFAAVSSSDAAIIIPCEVQSTPLLPLLLAMSPGQTPLAADKLTVLVQPLAVKLGAGGTRTPLPVVPAGRYQIVVIEKSGQVWTLPNSLGTQDAGSKYYVPSQGQRITISTALAPGGSISGKVHYPANRKFGNLVVQAYRGGPQFAPPLAALPPTRVKLVPGQFIAPADSTVPFTVDYTIDSLPAGPYVVEALDDGDGNFNSLNLLQTPTKGDLVGGVLSPNLGTLQVIDVQGAVTGKDVTLDLPANLLGIDAPAFEFDESAGPAQIAQDARGVVRLTVKAKPPAFPIWSATQAAFLGAGSAQTTFFTVGLVRDAAGNPVDSDADGLPDVWPRALLVKLSDGDASNLTQGTPTTVIPVAVDPTPFLPALLSGAKDLVLPATKLSLIVRPAALDASDPSAPKRLPAMPAGKYKLVLLNKTGQVWQLPNEAGVAALDPRVGTCTTSCQPGQVSSAAQGRFFSVVPPAAALPSGEIDGTLTIAGSATSTSIAIFAWHVEDPPPPLGTSASPASADLHLGADLVAGQVAGTKMVNFALRALPKGDYYVTAVVDTRGDFALAPQLWGAAPGPGALAGGVLNALHSQLARVTVDSAAVTGVSALASAASPLPARPSFAISQSGSPVVADLTTLFPDALTPQRITLHAGGKVDASSAWLPVLDGATAALKPESGQSQFAVAYRGCSGGVPVDSDFDNLPDVWPRVLVVKLSDADPSGLTPDPVTTLIPAAVDPLRFLPSTSSTSTLPAICDTATAVATSEVDVILSPIAIQPQPSGALKQLPIPAGRYGIVLITQSGQVWRLPNELAPALLDPRAAATPAGQALASQGVSIRVAAQVPAPLGGAITGAVKLPNYAAADVGNLVVLAYLASAPPPPAGLGRPVAVQLIPKPVVAGAAGSAQPFLLANLPPGVYLAAALLDPLGQLSTSFGFMSTPPKGAQLSFFTGGGAGPTPIVVGSSLVLLPDATGITLDKLQLSNVIPFDRPAFAVDLTSTLSLSAGSAPATPAVLRLLPTVPAGVPYALPSTPAFHPVPARDASGLPYRDPSPGAAACAGGAFKPWVSTQVYASPIDTGQRYVAAVKVDACQFCQSLTGTADCSSAPLAPPSGPLPFAGPLVAAVLNLAIDPLTKAPAGVPLPLGHYAITVVEPTGLVWTVPNDLREVGGAASALQGFAFTVAP